ncbi:hypothetical protein, partial [Ulvibacter litoralis]|uniref:hypothetical protein n=1 Tax=Ulvibacter litoralis TaxID=227084 RepID=UPI001E4C2699
VVVNYYKLLNINKKNMNYKKRIYLLTLISTFILSTLLTSCDYQKEKSLKEQKKQWVYIELTTVSPRDTTDYFYFGQIKESLIGEIDSNEEKKGLFTLSNIRYWNDDDLLELYEDDKLKGSMIFKIQDIQEITLYKDDPLNLYDLEEIDESAKAKRAKGN